MRSAVGVLAAFALAFGTGTAQQAPAKLAVVIGNGDFDRSGVVDVSPAAEAAATAAEAAIVFGPTKEAWGLRRFVFRDPAGNLVNVVNS